MARAKATGSTRSAPEAPAGLRPPGDDPSRKLIGWSEIWRPDSTGARVFYLCFVPVLRRHFHHSTWLDT